jgi:hypothetical protein
MATASNLKAHLFDLSDFDRECLIRIRERLEVSSNALAVRMAIRSLAKRLADPSEVPENNNVSPVVAPVAATITPARDAAAPLKKSHFVPFSALPKPIATFTLDSDGITRPIGSRPQPQIEEG